MIQNLIFRILFLKILIRAYNVFIFLQTFQWTLWEFFFNFRFSSTKSQSQQKLAKTVPHFIMQFRSRNLTHFTNLNSLDIKNDMLLQHSQKPKNLSSDHVFVWCQKKYFHCTISWLPRTALLKPFESKWLYISKYFLKNFFVSET